jgi:CubicO group peptidase (beta-lactamase class C family)
VTEVPLESLPPADAAELDAWANVDEWGRLLPQGQELVTLANWQTDPHQRWAFQHMRELMPSQVIDGTDEPRSLPERPVDVSTIALETSWAPTVADLIAETDTDGFLVMHRGELLFEQYAAPLTRRRKHLVMSVTKSVVSCVAASLWADGLLDPDAPVETYVPELAGCGYAGATVRTLLDMRSGILFRETYVDPASEVRVMERSMGWAPRGTTDPIGMYPYILTIQAEGAHDDVFDYRSIDTDTLGWVCERAAGERMADLISTRVWQPMGAFHDAEITADPLGFAIHDGGLSSTLRDLGRFGQMLLDRGRVGERQVIPEEWIETTLNPPEDVRDAFARSVNEPYMPGSWYRNQFWVTPGDNGPIQLALGIHGQMVFMEPSTGLVGVKLSSWAAPQDSGRLHATIAAFRQIGRELQSQQPARKGFFRSR